MVFSTFLYKFLASIKHYFLTLTFILFPFFLFGQIKNFDFGFHTGISFRQSFVRLKGDDFKSIETESRLGGGLRFGVYYFPWNSLALRIAPAVYMEQDVLLFISNEEKEELYFAPMMIIVPLHAQYQAFQQLPLKLVAGPSLYWERHPGDNAPLEKFESKKIETAVEVGLAYSFNIKNVKLEPEIKYSIGLNNVSGNNSTTYGQSIESLKRNRFLFSIYLRNNWE